MWKSRDPSYLRDATRKPWGRQQGRKHPLTNSKKTFHSNTQSVTHVPTFAPANRRKQQAVCAVPYGASVVALLWTKLGSCWALFLWDEKCVHTHTSLVACLVTPKKTLFPASAKQKLISRQTHRKLVCTGCLFSICFKKTHWFKTCFHACKTNVSSLKCPNSHHLSFQHTKRW